MGLSLFCQLTATINHEASWSWIGVSRTVKQTYAAFARRSCPNFAGV